MDDEKLFSILNDGIISCSWIHGAIDKLNKQIRLSSPLAVCPNCKKMASGEAEVLKSFGIRCYQKKHYVQSWCRDCRSRQI